MMYEKKTVYVYEVDGVEKMQITSEAEAKQWDSIFETASKLYQVMNKHELGLELSAGDRSELCIYLAKHKQDFYRVLQAAVEPQTRHRGPERAAPLKTNAQSQAASKDTTSEREELIDVPDVSNTAKHKGFNL